MSLPIEIISTDFDGTLHADEETPPVPQRLQALIRQLQDQGAKWVINTGRDFDSLTQGMNGAELEVQPDYLVVLEREIYVREDGHYAPWQDWNGACRLAHAELFARIQPDMPRLVDWITERFTVTLFEDDYSPLWVIARSNGDADAIHAHFAEYCRQVPDLAVVRNEAFAAFAHAAYNKGVSLGEIANRLGVPAERVFAAGDHFNDLPMLSREFAGCLVAPDNAILAVKEKVRAQDGYVSQEPWGHGVACGLEYYLRNHA